MNLTLIQYWPCPLPPSDTQCHPMILDINFNFTSVCYVFKECSEKADPHLSLKTVKQTCKGIRDGKLSIFLCLRTVGKSLFSIHTFFPSSFHIMKGEWWTQKQGNKEQLPSTTNLSVLNSAMFPGQVNHFKSPERTKSPFWGAV